MDIMYLSNENLEGVRANPLNPLCIRHWLHVKISHRCQATMQFWKIGLFEWSIFFCYAQQNVRDREHLEFLRFNWVLMSQTKWSCQSLSKFNPECLHYPYMYIFSAKWESVQFRNCTCALWEFLLCPPIPEFYRTILELRKEYFIDFCYNQALAQSRNGLDKVRIRWTCMGVPF